MATSQKQITDALRAQYTNDLIEYLSAKYDTDVCRTAAGTLMIPVVDSAGEDRWIKISVIVPKEADEESGTDGYSLAKEYDLKLEAAEDRKRKAAEKAAKAQAKANSKSKAS